MAITIELPQVGESVVEGIIGKWLKNLGDWVDKYEPLLEVVTDKVTMEVPSPMSGVLVTILQIEGSMVPMGSPIAEIEPEQIGQVQVQYSVNVSTTSAKMPKPNKTGAIGRLIKDVKPVGPTGGGIEEDGNVIEIPDRTISKSYSPVVRRLAREHEVDLRDVSGSGVGGRISRDDVLRFIELQEQTGTSVRQTNIGPKVTQGQSGPVLSKDIDRDIIVPLSPIRRAIAERMTRSIGQIPHAWTMVEVDVSNLVANRESLKNKFLNDTGVELSYLSFIIKAVIDALKEYPILNSRWAGDSILLKKDINVGVAVATDRGLMVPVVRGVESYNISELAFAIAGLTLKAREGTLTLEDVTGGTFTVNNTGALGSVLSQPIINFPQTGILTTEAILRRPRVVDVDSIAILSVMNICLSFDHRILDGSEAGAFMQSVKKKLEAIAVDGSI